MQIEFLVNGGVSLLISPENEMEEHLLKQLAKQNNDITEIRSTIIVLNKTFRGGILIGKRSANLTEIADIAQQKASKDKENTSDDDQAGAV